jgi:hypothetical protein
VAVVVALAATVTARAGAGGGAAALSLRAWRRGREDERAVRQGPWAGVDRGQERKENGPRGKKLAGQEVVSARVKEEGCDFIYLVYDLN